MKTKVGFTRIIDIHSHFLPESDDGFSSPTDSLNDIKRFYEEGVTDIILTPHHRRRYNLPPEELKCRFENYKKKVSEIVPVSLYLGQEIYAQEDIKEDLKAGKLLTMNGTEYVLIEFSFNVEAEISETVYELANLGYKPIVAHLERYAYADLSVAEDIKSVGGFIQINADSLIDGERTYRKKAREFLKNGLVDFIASDHHHKRPFALKKALGLVERKRGVETAEKLFFGNAAKITDKD